MEQVTVIIPMYNAQPYIRVCIRSLMNQTFCGWKAVVVDDGSTDGSAQICRELCAQDQRITLICQENRGVSAARNRGLDAAQGEYVFFLDSDDAIHPLLLEELVRQAEETGAGTACCAAAVLESGQLEKTLAASLPKDARPHWMAADEETAQGWFHEQNENGSKGMWRIGGHLIRRKCIGALRFEENLTNGEDTLFMYSLMCGRPSAVYSPQAWYYYRMRPESLTHSLAVMKNRRRFDAFRMIRDSELGKGHEAAALAWERRLVFSLIHIIDQLKAAKDAQGFRILKEQAVAERRVPLFHKLSAVERLLFFNRIYCTPAYILMRELILARRRMMAKTGRAGIKVGILTFHCSDNFGAMLQAYGLKTYLCGHEVSAEIVRYEPPFMTGRHWKIPYAPLKGLKGRLWCVWNAWDGWKRNRAMGDGFYRQKENMRRFRSQYLVEEKRGRLFFTGCLHWPDYRIYLVGSDQIWNPEITCGLRRAYFGAFHNKRREKVVAFGASLGGSSLPAKYDRRFSRLMKNLDAVSLREPEAASYVKRFWQGKITAVCDPVFLLGQGEWQALEKRPEYSGYIFVYTTQRDEQLYQYAKTLSQEKGVPVLELKVEKTAGKEDFPTDYTAGPAEFLGYIHQAAYVVTNSFHAAAFSIIYQKQFLAFLHSTRGTRISHLLESHGLEGRLYRPGASIDDPIDWEAVQKSIEENRKESEAFLAGHVF